MAQIGFSLAVAPLLCIPALTVTALISPGTATGSDSCYKMGRWQKSTQAGISLADRVSNRACTLVRACHTTRVQPAREWSRFRTCRSRDGHSERPT